MAAKKGKPASLKQPKPEASFPRWLLGHTFSLIRRHGSVIAFWLGIAYIARQASLAFIAYAGRASVANLRLDLMANISFVWTASFTMTGLSITLYLRERMLHRKTRERLTARITELELIIDSSRTSSLLTPRGLTQKGDE